jgi:hypothetical protein
MARNRRGSRRTTRWVTFNPSANTITAGTPEVATVITAADAVVGATILRVVGSISWLGTTVDTATRYMCGLLVAPNLIDADDIDPDVNANLDWLYWAGEGSRNPAYDGVDSFVEHPRWIDVRGRRRISEGESLLFAENSIGTNVVSFVKLRLLVLNP